EFTQANGQLAVGAVRLDAQTGATAPGWQPSIENRLSGGSPVVVRTFDVQGDWLYIGGQFTHLASGGSNPIYARMLARISLTTGRPDAQWTPILNGTVVSVDA